MGALYWAGSWPVLYFVPIGDVEFGDEGVVAPAAVGGDGVGWLYSVLVVFCGAVASAGSDGKVPIGSAVNFGQGTSKNVRKFPGRPKSLVVGLKYGL